MADKNIKRFCELVVEINRLNEKIQIEKANFYDGGHSFEECFSEPGELKVCEAEFAELFKKMNLERH